MKSAIHLRRASDRLLPRSARACWVLAAICFSQLSLAWSSKDFPLFEPVHQIAIDVVLKSLISSGDLQLLQDQQIVVDRDQKAPESYEHSMTGVDKGESYDPAQKAKYIQLAEDFIRKNINAAIAAKKTGDHQHAMEALGNAIHPLEDATSPAHAPFQAWHYNEGVFAIAHHITKERIYPNTTDTVQADYKARLEGSVRWAYDLFLEKISMPTHFFNSDGTLQIPMVYLH